MVMGESPQVGHSLPKVMSRVDITLHVLAIQYRNPECMSFAFQSLFFWMMHIGGLTGQSPTVVIRFQSLFFWMMHIGAVEMTQQGVSSQVSILVLLDDAHREGSVCRRRVDVGEFQSLFFWMMHIGPPELGRPARGRQVSILVLLDDAHRGPVQARLEQADQVSILVLLDDAHRGRGGLELGGSPLGFNPCSSG